VCRALLVIAIGCTALATPVVAAEYKCTGQEKGINSMTGKERVMPFTYRIRIVKNKATIDGLANVVFKVDETDAAYTLKAAIGKSRVAGEYVLRIDKHTGSLKGKSWLFARDNVTTREGKCARMKDSEIQQKSNGH
jgi:hypothetical protein